MALGTAGVKETRANVDFGERRSLAILPGLTHYTIFKDPALVQAVLPFLDAG